MSCNADTTANTLLATVLQGKQFNLPDTDLNDAKFLVPDSTGDLFTRPVMLKNEDLTTRTVDGSGVFDALMSGIAAHLKKEYEQNRITGQQYTEAFVAAAGGAMSTATQFLLGRDQAYWQAVTAQIQARALEVAVVTARVQLETAKAELARTRMQVLTVEAEYGLTKMKLATEDQQYCLLIEQTRQAEEAIKQAEYTLRNLMPEQYKGLQLDNSGKTLDNATKTFTNTFILPAQRDLLLEQIEVQRAQTLDSRTNGAVIMGSVGKQKDLYTQQIISYQRDAEVKAAKLFTDAWITQKTIDEGLLAPNGFTNASIDTILTNLKTKNQLS